MKKVVLMIIVAFSLVSCSMSRFYTVTQSADTQNMELRTVGEVLKGQGDKIQYCKAGDGKYYECDRVSGGIVHRVEIPRYAYLLKRVVVPDNDIIAAQGMVRIGLKRQLIFVALDKKTNLAVVAGTTNCDKVFGFLPGTQEKVTRQYCPETSNYISAEAVRYADEYQGIEMGEVNRVREQIWDPIPLEPMLSLQRYDRGLNAAPPELHTFLYRLKQSFSYGLFFMRFPHDEIEKHIELLLPIDRDGVIDMRQDPIMDSVFARINQEMKQKLIEKSAAEKWSAVFSAQPIMDLVGIKYQKNRDVRLFAIAMLQIFRDKDLQAKIEKYRAMEIDPTKNRIKWAKCETDGTVFDVCQEMDQEMNLDEIKRYALLQGGTDEKKLRNLRRGENHTQLYVDMAYVNYFGTPVKVGQQFKGGKAMVKVFSVCDKTSFSHCCRGTVTTVIYGKEETKNEEICN